MTNANLVRGLFTMAVALFLPLARCAIQLETWLAAALECFL